jgi:hypothetical protein
MNAGSVAQQPNISAAYSVDVNMPGKARRLAEAS